MKDWLRLLPKGELHVHLNGLVSTSLIRHIIQEEKVGLPSNFQIDNDLIISRPQANLNAYLKPWEVLRLIPSTRINLKLLVQNAFDNLKKENISFAEIRNSVIYIAHLNDISVELALAWLLEEIEEASDIYGIQAGLILSVSRGDYCADHIHTLLKSYEGLGKPKSIVGLDLAGNEDIILPNYIASLFKDAKQKYNLKSTIHAGETGNIDNIIDAIDNFEADRIGHGTAAGNNIEIMEYIREKNICIEVCPISNRLTGAVKEDDFHPVVEFVKNNVPFVICADNPSLHAKTLTDDYAAFFYETKNKKILENMFDLQKKYSFMEGLK